MKDKNLIRFFKLVVEKNKSKLIISFLLVFTISIIDLLLPQITRAILDKGIAKSNMSLLIKLVLIYGVLSIGSSLISIVLEYLYSIMKNTVVTNLKIRLLNHLSKLSGKYFSGIKTGNILSIIESDIFILKSFNAELIYSIVVNLFTAICAMFFLLKIQYDLFLIVLVLQLALVLFQSRVTKIIAKKTRYIRDESGKISNITQEYISNIMNVILTKSKLKFFKLYLKQEKNLIKKFLELDMIMSGNIAISRILSGLITITIYGYGGYKIINKSMTLGELIAFQQYTGMLIGPCVSIIRSSNRIQQLKVSLDRLFTVIDENIEIKVNNQSYKLENKLCNQIEFKYVCFKYNENNNHILNDINLKFKYGEITGLVGGSGCGKSTIVNLLYRFWDVSEGSISINNINIKDINLKSLRNNINIVTQDLLIFDDTIKNNIKLNSNINDENLKEICEAVGLNDLIESFDEGFNTIVGEKGVKISGGQKQRIAIARALASDSQILIFDEATSALDNISQRTILENINGLLKNKIVIVIAHRLSTIKNADKIYVIDKGIVSEAGTHKELLLNESIYYDLVNEQTQEIAYV